MITNITDFLKENNAHNNELIEFLKNKEFKNSVSNRFLYHGTDDKPNDFILDDDFYNTDKYYDCMPYGHVFLSNNISESSSYGKYIIPCELQHYDHIIFDVDSNSFTKFASSFILFLPAK